MAALTSVVPTSGNSPEIPDSSVKQGVCVWHGADHYNYDVIVSVGGKRGVGRCGAACGYGRCCDGPGGANLFGLQRPSEH